METKKLFLYGFLFAIGFLLWRDWQARQIVVVATPSIVSQRAEVTRVDNSSSQPPATHVVTRKQESAFIAPASDRLIDIQTDVLYLKLDKNNGDLVEAKLLQYSNEIDQPDDYYVLQNTKPGRFYLAQSGFRTISGGVSNITFSSDKQSYSLSDGKDELLIQLTGRNEKGLEQSRTLLLRRGSYLIEQQDEIKNSTSQAWQGYLYRQLVRVEPKGGQKGMFGMVSYLGASISDPEHKLYEKVSFKEMRKNNLSRTIQDGWLAMQEHYFLSAWVPADSKQPYHYYSQTGELGDYTIGMRGSLFELMPGAVFNTQAKFYVGPENAETLKQVAPGLDLTIDYGWLWFISVFLFKVLKYVYSVVGNWGWAIVVVTLFIKLAFYHLSATSYRSMANMRKLQPRIQTLRDRYKDDRAKLSQEMMGLYKKEKINPLGGCLPIIVQIPVFIALYWVLLESVELRHAPFLLWIRDLSTPDPFYILPILMGATMLVQQKLSPPPPDPTQAKLMMALPIVFTFLFLQFPAGLVLYWTVNNGLSILQQWYITRKIEMAGKFPRRTA